MWLDRLPPEYRRRYYTNLAVIVGFVVFFFVVGKLDKQHAASAIVGLICFLLLWGLVWPLIRLLQRKPRPHRAAFILYGASITAYAYVAAAYYLPMLAPAVPEALVLGLVLMWIVLIGYRKVIFPDFFDGAYRKRFRIVREAQRAERADR